MDVLAFAGERYLLRCVRRIGRVVRGEQVIANAATEFRAGGGFLVLAIFFELGFAFVAFGDVACVVLWHRLFAEERFVIGFAAAREDAVERIIIFGGNRVVFVIVAPG